MATDCGCFRVALELASFECTRWQTRLHQTTTLFRVYFLQLQTFIFCTTDGAEYNLIYIDGDNNGRVLDVGALSSTALYTAMEEGRLPIPKPK